MQTALDRAKQAMARHSKPVRPPDDLVDKRPRPPRDMRHPDILELFGLTNWRLR